MSTEPSTLDASNENNLTSMTDRTSTCFPKLPLELRNMVWTYGANLPRNLDIWAPTIGEEMTFHWNYHQNSLNFHPFKFCSTRPVPGILHANRESRTIALKFYELSFGTEFNPAHHLKFTTPARIYTNFQADRVCPMGTYGLDALSDLWLSQGPFVCAFNVCNDWPSPYKNPTFVRMEGSLSDSDSDSYLYEEIFLYYCGDLFPSSGSFEFVELDQVKATPEEWEVLKDAREKLLQAYEEWEQEKRHIAESYEQEGKEYPEGMFTTFVTPRVKLVALVVDGVRQ
ncbi:hypothetical protein LARI1_G003218 [Lachnellula arida]|uniref:2EXR domain-containing protein n=1 Tax=Lachnellula arida TaxID=1316785 RepID=A0A8T9BMN5_9HELO|nr:hypothetical protein LARI1_G003218 [Lachnellula arida]